VEHVFSLRMPEQWHGRFSSDQLRRWVLDWAAEPVALRDDPGAGRAKMSVRFSGTELARLRRLSRRSVSSTCRAVAALHVSTEQNNTWKWIKGSFEFALVLLYIFVKAKAAEIQSEDKNG
jgi:hypothetical protein